MPFSRLTTRFRRPLLARSAEFSAVISLTGPVRLSPYLVESSYDVATTVRTALSIAPEPPISTRYGELGLTNVAS